MNESARSLSILRDIAPALKAARDADGYYPPLAVVRDIIAARHGEAAANTLYHNGLTRLIQRHITPLYSAKGAREFAQVGRRHARQMLQGFDWFGGHASPFQSALAWLFWKLERVTVGEVIRARSDLTITRTDESAFKVRYGSRSMPVYGADYPHSIACLCVALLYGRSVEKQVRGKPEAA